MATLSRTFQSNSRPIIHRFLLLFLLMALVSPLSAAFKDVGWGVRPEGMGGAFAAVANDANAVAYNPAGSSLMEASEVSFAYSRPYVGFVEDQNIGMFYTSYAKSLRRYSGYGAAWASLSSPSLKEDALILNASVNAGRVMKWGRDVIVGANAKRMTRSFKVDDKSASDPVFRGGTDNTLYSYDFGSWIRPLPLQYPGASFGLVLKNLTQPDAGLRTEDIIPMEIVAGGAYQRGNVLFTMDFSRRDGVQVFRGGSEIAFFDRKVTARFGLNSYNGSFGMSYHQPFTRFSIAVDYAFIMPFYIEDSAGSHRISLALKR